MGTDHEAQYFVIVKDKSTAQIKADLVHAFLCVSANSFKYFGNADCYIFAQFSND